MYKFPEVRAAYGESRKYAGSNMTAPFPPYVTFELTNICNYRCMMCPVSYTPKKRQELDPDLFKKAIDEISGYGSLVRFIGYEEPFLYTKIKDAIKYVKKSGLLLHITTNGSLLNDQLADFIVDSGVDSMIFSFQGLTKEEYCLIRNTTNDVYGKVIKNMEMLYNRRKGNKPYMKVTTTITARDGLADKGAFISTHLSHADEVQITGFTHFIHVAELFGRDDIWSNLKISRPKEIAGDIRCSIPNYEMIIKSDGNVYPCCGAFGMDLCIGNINDHTIYDIWHSEKASEIRKIVGDGHLSGFQECSVCPIKFEYEEIGNTVKNAEEDKTEKFRQGS